MDILFAIVTLLAACLLLYKGADWLVGSSIATAQAIGISKLMVGITVVAFGTSLPEMLVSWLAAFEGMSALSLGNIIGSCIFNLAIVIGVSAIITPYPLPFKEIRNSLLVLIFANIIFTLVLLNSVINWVEGLIMLASFGTYITFLIFSERKGLKGKPKILRGKVKARDIVFMILGLVGLVLGAQLLVTSASFLARQIGIDELVIGISVVALGTSLPEVATSVVASVKKNEEISFANVIGSNVANLLLIIGFVAMVQSISSNINELLPDLLMLHGITILLLVLFLTLRKLSRTEGIVLVAVYIAYMIYLYMR
jgi:cation:H+ antiporter